MEPLSEMSAPVWFTVIFACTGVFIITLFACRNGVFENRCCCTNHGNGAHQPARYGIGVGDGGSPRSEGMGSSQVSALRVEPVEEGAYGEDQEESRRSGGLSSDERSEENEDWGGTV